MSARRTSRPDKFSYALGKRFLSLFPASFRKEFGDPLLQAIQDELHTEANSRVQIITIWLRIIPDLLLAAFQEQYHQWSKDMNIPRRLLQVLGATLLVYWVTMFSWSLLKAFHVLPLQDPFSLVMGPEQTTLEILLFEKSLAYGPPLAFLIFLAPSIRVERVRDAGGVLIRILRIPHSAWIPLGASAAISVIILGLVLLQFLGIML